MAEIIPLQPDSANTDVGEADVSSSSPTNLNDSFYTVMI